jgi:protein-disulfide isomerase
VGSFSVERLQQMASMAGLDRSAFDAGLQLDVARRAFADIRADFEADATRLGIRSTPTIVVDGERLEANDLETIRAAIDAALAAD